MIWNCNDCGARVHDSVWKKHKCDAAKVPKENEEIKADGTKVDLNGA